MKLRSRRPAPATVIALLSLFVALGGPAEAKRLIDGNDIRKGTVRSRAVKDRSLTVRDLSRSAVAYLRSTSAFSIGTNEIALGAVTGDRIASGAIGATHLAAASVGSGAVADDSLTAAELAPDSVGTSELAAGSVRRGEVATNAVGASEIVNDAIDSNEVVDGGLAAIDIAAFTGTLTADLPQVAPGDCASVDQAVAPVRVTDPPQSIADDVVIVEKPVAWPDEHLTLDARPLDAATIRLTACNVGGALPVDPAADLSYRYLSIG